MLPLEAQGAHPPRRRRPLPARLPACPSLPQAFEQNMGRRSGADAKWLQQVRHGGTTSDRVAAMSVLVQDGAAANLASLDGLLAMCGKRGGEQGRAGGSSRGRAGLGGPGGWGAAGVPLLLIRRRGGGRGGSLCFPVAPARPLPAVQAGCPVVLLD